MSEKYVMQIRHFSHLKIISYPYGPCCFKFQPNDSTCHWPAVLFHFPMISAGLELFKGQGSFRVSTRRRPGLGGSPWSLHTSLWHQNRDQAVSLLGKWEKGDLVKVTIFFFPSTSYFLLKYRQLTILWLFQVDSKGAQPYIHMCPFPLKLPFHPGYHITLSGVPCAIQ